MLHLMLLNECLLMIVAYLMFMRMRLYSFYFYILVIVEKLLDLIM